MTYQYTAIDKHRMARIMSDIESKEFDYEYPEDLNLHPKSDLSKDICRRGELIKKQGRRVIEGSEAEWRKTEWSTTTFVPLSAVEQAERNEDPRRPLATMIPYSLGTLDTLVAWMMNAYLRQVIHRYKGYGSKNAVANAIIRQKIIARYGQFYKEALKMTAWYRDMFVYGVGVIGLNWRKHKTRNPENRPVGDLLSAILQDEGLDYDANEIIRIGKEKVEFEGTELTNIDIWNCYFDPKTTMNEFRKSQWFGYMYQTHPFDEVNNEKDPEEFTFNWQYVRILSEQGAAKDPDYNNYSSGRNTRTGTDSVNEEIRAPLNELVQPFRWCERLIPSERGLGDSDESEIWCFETIVNRVVTRCWRLDNDHGLLPFAVIAHTTDGQDVMPVSTLASTLGSQEAMDWLIRSRIQNGMMSMHNMFVADSSKVFIKDFMQPGPFKIVRLRPGAYGEKGIDSFIKQIPITDVTQGHYGDMQMLMNIAKEANGTVDVLRGDMSQMPERPGQAGVQSAVQGAASRLRKIAQITAWQGMYDIAYMHGKNVDQYMDEEVWLELLGDEDDIIREIYGVTDQVNIGPYDLEGGWEVIAHIDQTTQNENFSTVTQVMQTLMQVPENAVAIANEMDIGRIFRMWAKMGGFDDMERMRRQRQAPAVALMQDQYAQQQMQAGNIIPQQQAQAMLMQRAA